jgi:hypothetical protein
LKERNFKMTKSYELDHEKWRGRSQLLGSPSGGTTVYGSGPQTARWIWDSEADPLLAKLEDAQDTAFRAFDGLVEHEQNVIGSQRYSERGIREEVDRVKTSKTMPETRKAREQLAKVESEIAGIEAGLKTTSKSKFDKEELIEARNALRAMSHREIVTTLAGSNPDQLFVEAALTANPNLIRNVSPSILTVLRERSMQERHGPELERLEVLRNAAAATRRNLDAVDQGLSSRFSATGERGRPEAPAPRLVNAG